MLPIRTLERRRIRREHGCIRAPAAVQCCYSVPNRGKSSLIWRRAEDADLEACRCPCIEACEAHLGAEPPVVRRPKLWMAVVLTTLDDDKTPNRMSSCRAPGLVQIRQWWYVVENHSNGVETLK